MNIKNTRSYFLENQIGSSLIGVAILTLVMGFLMTGAIYLIQNYDAVKSDQKTADITVTLQNGINNFVAVNKRYPCPARMDLGPDEPGFGIEECSIPDVNGRGGEPVKVGTAPVRTLNIPDKMIVDGHGRRHTYAITASMTSSTPLPDLTNGLGAISLKDETGASVSNLDGYIIYALMSAGEDDRGAFDIKGREIEPCPTSGLTAENCNGDATFIASSQKSFRGESNDFTSSFAFKGSTIAYDWNTSTWSECGKSANGNKWNNNPHPRPSCFSSYQARPIVCRDRQGNTVDETLCDHTPKPDAERVCSLGPCRWKTIPAKC